jgi:hypothetical protein
MKNVKAIIDLLAGGLANLTHLRVEVKGFMRLVIERVGDGPNGLPLVSVAHYFEQNGDAMRDPEMCFEVSPDGTFYPVDYLQDSLGIYHRAVWRDDDGRVLVSPYWRKDLAAFARTWDRNLGQQGFVDAARRMAAARRGG